MGMTSGPGRGGLKSDINVTPLVDVVLVLLIIFMVVTPMMKKGKDVRLPKVARSAKEPKPTEPLVVSVTLDQQLYVESDRFSDPVQFKTRLQKELRVQPMRRILLKADHALACGDVQRVMELILASGAKSVGMGVEELHNP